MLGPTSSHNLIWVFTLNQEKSLLCSLTSVSLDLGLVTKAHVSTITLQVWFICKWILWAGFLMEKSFQTVFLQQRWVCQGRMLRWFAQTQVPAQVHGNYPVLETIHPLWSYLHYILRQTVPEEEDEVYRDLKSQSRRWMNLLYFLDSKMYIQKNISMCDS